jgi:uncharacterized membrane protein
MQSQEILQTISAVAVALAGFSGVVVVLGHRSRGNWSSTELLQLRTLVEPSLVALFGSFLPGTIRLASQSEVLIWRCSNGALGVLGLAAVAAFIARVRFARPTVGQRVLLVLATLAVGAHLLVAGGVLTQAELIFVLGLILALVVAAYNFLLLLFSFGRAA